MNYSKYQICTYVLTGFTNATFNNCKSSCRPSKLSWRYALSGHRYTTIVRVCTYAHMSGYCVYTYVLHHTLTLACDQSSWWSKALSLRYSAPRAYKRTQDKGFIDKQCMDRRTHLPLLRIKQQTNKRAQGSALASRGYLSGSSNTLFWISWKLHVQACPEMFKYQTLTREICRPTHSVS